MNKKGELGMGMVMLIVLPILVLIMAGFVVLAIVFAKDVGFNGINNNQGDWKESLLLKNINVNDNNFLVIEAIIELEKSNPELNYHAVSEELKGFVSESNNCLVLMSQKNDTPLLAQKSNFYIIFRNGQAENIYDPREYYIYLNKFKNLFEIISFEVRDVGMITVKYYYGHCPEVNK